MKAVLWIRRADTQPLAQLLDRPFVQHVIEQIVARGVSSVEFFLGTAHRDVANLLGNGTRWGIPIVCEVLCGPPTKADLERVCGSTRALALFGDASELPLLPALDPNGQKPLEPALFFEGEAEKSRWSGWALLPEVELPAFASQITGGSDRLAAFQSISPGAGRILLAGPSISAASAKHVIDANVAALSGGYPGLYHDGVEKEPGIWIARGVKVAPSAVIEAPCYIGEEVWIGEECHIGPMAVLGRESVVERGTRVVRSVLSEATYLGPELEVADSSVVQNVIYNVRLNTELKIEEEHVVSGLNQGPVVPSWVKLWVAPAFLLAVLILVFWLR